MTTAANDLRLSRGLLANTNTGGLLETGLIFCLAGLFAIALQFKLGAYHSEFGYDESSHYVSGLLIHDYLTSGFPESPLRFLRDFASAYPQVGIGHWGPFWYGIEALWMLLFGWSRAAMLVLSAVTTALIAAVMYRMAVKALGRLLAGFAALAFVFSPVTQVSSASVMLDGAMALICLLAAISWFRYSRAPNYTDATAFGLLATAGLLTKGNAGCLVLVPPLFLLLDRNWGLMKRASFWLPAGIVLLLAGPWSVATYHLVAQGFRFGWGWPYSSVAVVENFRILVTAFGPLLLLLVPLGAIPLFASRTGETRDLAATGFVLLVAVLVFQCVVPAAIQDRYLEPALPPLMLLAALGIHQFTARPVLRLLAVGMVTLAALPWVLQVPIKRQFDTIEAMQQIWRYRVADNPSVLIVSEGGAEGAAVAEIAMLDKARPSMFAVRGSRLLGGGRYNTQDYQPRFHDPKQVLEAIDQYAIPLVLVRREPARDDWAHIAQVEQARALQPERWHILYRKIDGPVSVTLYALAGNDKRKLDVQQMKQLTGPRSL